jgi:hypothetical protein
MLVMKRFSLVVSETFRQTIISIVQDIRQVSSIYIFAVNNTNHKQLVKQCSKVKGVFTEITLVCKALKQAVQRCDYNSISISFVSTDSEATCSGIYYILS